MTHPCDQIRKIRSKLGISQEYMANRLEISQTAYSKMKEVNTSNLMEPIYEETILELKKIIHFQLRLIDFIIKKGP